MAQHKTKQQKLDALSEFAKGLRVELFADRDTMQEAYDYAMNVANSFDGRDRVAIITVVHVLLNTVGKVVEEVISHKGSELILPDSVQ